MAKFFQGVDMDKIKLLSQHFSNSEIEFIVSETLCGEGPPMYYISKKYGDKRIVGIQHLNEIFRVRPNSIQVTFGEWDWQDIALKDLFADIVQAEKLLVNQEKTKSAISRRATKDYSTKLLDRLHQTIEEKWLNFDKKSPPKSESIILELKEHGLSQNEAIAIDLIARADSVREEKDRSKRKPKDMA